MKRKLHELNWEIGRKLRYWAVATILFAGSLRVSEVLSKNTRDYCRQSTLLERDVEIVNLRIEGTYRHLMRLKIKSPKEDRIGTGTVIEIFANGKFLCPIRAWHKYWKGIKKKPCANGGIQYFKSKKESAILGMI